jgi:hypothetical protein
MFERETRKPRLRLLGPRGAATPRAPLQPAATPRTAMPVAALHARPHPERGPWT